MNTTFKTDHQAVHAALDQIITLHGLRPVLAALVARLVRKTPRRPRPLHAELSAHMRRDIGLPPASDAPPRPPPFLMR